MLTRVLVYALLYPLSLLPLSILYRLATAMRFCVFTLGKYRQEVVIRNLRNSFPDKTYAEIQTIHKAFQRHFCHIFIEGVKLLTISRRQLLQRYVCRNPELANQYAQEGRSIILISSHYNNWEWMVLSLSLQFHFHGVGVGKPNTDKVFEKLINRARTRYGTEVVFADTVREVFARYDAQNRKTAYMMLSDQAPGNAAKSYRTVFLHQPSAMIYGAEYFAKKYNYPVLYYVVHQLRRGYYEIELRHVADAPQRLPYGAIIETYVSHLQNDISHQPAYWLWSHKRWKHTTGIR
jgi:KDO2-lipid IV(A) lauroyltransferase